MSCNCYCEGHDNYYECPVMYYSEEANYPVPMLRHPDIDRPLYYWYKVTTILLYFRFHGLE